MFREFSSIWEIQACWVAQRDRSRSNRSCLPYSLSSVYRRRASRTNSLRLRPSWLITCCTRSAISRGRQKVMVLDFLGAGIVSLSALLGILITLATVLHILEKRK